MSWRLRASEHFGPDDKVWTRLCAQKGLELVEIRWPDDTTGPEVADNLVALAQAIRERS